LVFSSKSTFLLDQSVFLLLAIAFFGAAGGTLRGINIVRKGSTKTRSLINSRSSWSVLVRPLVGALAALAISVFVFAGVLQLGIISNYLLLANSYSGLFGKVFSWRNRKNRRLTRQKA
jgi:hypothetical protein